MRKWTKIPCKAMVPDADSCEMGITENIVKLNPGTSCKDEAESLADLVGMAVRREIAPASKGTWCGHTADSDPLFHSAV